MMSPEEFVVFADRFSEAALLLNREGIVLAANRAFRRLQLAPASPLGHHLTELTSSDDQHVRAYLRDCARNRQPILGVLTFQTVQGESVTCRCDGGVLQPAADREATQLLITLVPREQSSLQFAVLNQKITDLNKEVGRRKQLQRELLSQGESLRVTLASIGDGVIVSDTEGRITFINPVAEALTGWRFEEALGQLVTRVFRVVDEVTGQPVEDFAAEAMQSQTSAAVPNHRLLISKTDRRCPIDDRAAPIHDRDGQVLGVVLVFRDVSSRRAAEIEQGRLAALVDSSEDAILGLTFQGIVTDWNAGAEKLYGFSAEEMVGASVLDRIVPGEQIDEFLATLGSVQRGEQVEPIETLRKKKNGQLVPVTIRVSPILDSELNVVGASAIDRDISSQKAAERRRAARLAVTEVLATEKDLQQAIANILGVLGSMLKWDVVVFWQAGGTPEQLRLRQAWWAPEVDAAYRRWAASRTAHRPRGQGLCGQAWQRRRPLWVADLANDPQADKAQDLSTGHWQSAFVYPIGVDDAFLGVIELYSRERRPRDPDLIETMGTVVSQLLQFLERCYAENQLRLSRQELLGSEERLRLALDAGRMGSWEWNIASGAVIWSATLEKIHGLAEGEFAGTFEAYQRDIHPDDRTHVLKAIENTLQQGKVHHIEYRIVWPDGSVHWLESRGRVFHDSDGQPLRMIGICSDVTERKQLEQALRFLAESSKSLSTLVDYKSTLQSIATLSVPHFADWCAVDMLEADGTVQRLAVAHADPAKLAIAEELYRRYPPRPDAEHGAMRVLRSGEAELVTEIPDAMLVGIAQDETHLSMLRQLSLSSFMCVPLRVKDNVLGAVTFAGAESGRRYNDSDLAMATDLAHRAAIAIQNALLYQQVREADRRKDEFLAMLAHELRNPLAPIRSGLDLLSMESGEHQQIVQLMQDQLEHVVRLVDDLLDVSRIMRGKVDLRKENVELAELVERSVRAVQFGIDSRQQQLNVQSDGEPLYVNVDPVRIVQVIENLLTNASKYMDAGGRIDLTVKRQGEQAVLTVRDTGVGIEKELLPRVFDLFTQSSRALDRSQGGLGIGLTLVQRLVEMHAGSVSAHSDGLGCGSTFEVRLPRVQKACLAAKPTRDDVQVAACRVCVVDDNRSAAWLLKALLMKLGNHHVQTAADGPAVLTMLHAFQPQVVFLDIGLPGMDGHQVAREIRRQDEFDHVLLVALTGYGQEEDRQKSQQAGFDLHLVKPPSVDQIKTVFAHPKLAAQPEQNS